MADDLSLTESLAGTALHVIQTVRQTSYTHQPVIDAQAGVYDVDCSAFAGFLIETIAGRHYAEIADAAASGRPLAQDFYDFAAAQPFAPSGGWRQVRSLAHAVRGDVVVWRLDRGPGTDTGHVFVVAAPAIASPQDAAWSVVAYDSSEVLHFNDSRGPGKPFANGVGEGAIHLRTDNVGAPTAFRFNCNAEFESVPVVILRLLPFSDE